MITKTLGDFEHYVNDGNYGNIYPKSSEFLSEGIPFVSASDFNGRIFNLNGIKHISLDMHNNLLTKGHITKNDILFVVRGNGIGKVGIFKEDIPECNINAQLAFYRIQNNCINSDYLYYLLSSKCYFKVIQNFSTGSAQPQLPINRLLQIPIKYDENVEHQKKIVNILSTLDKKIELNNKIISELEGISKTLYNYWFLQFEFPNAEGNPYKSSGGKMVYNEQLKKEIPEGWEVKTLSEISNMYQPSTFDAKLLEDNGKYRVYGAGGYMGQYHEYNHEEQEIFISCRGSCGNIYKSMPKSLITGNAMIVHPLDKSLFDYLYWALLRYGVRQCITGSVQPQITRDSLNDWKLIFPPLNLLQKFNSIVIPISSRLNNIVYENQKLTSLRDFLLPLLMNGQVTIGDKDEK